MSTHALRCKDCGRECLLDRCAPFGDGQEGTYAVSWRCSEGHGLSLDVCPVGPLIPTKDVCINCGTRYSSDSLEPTCMACGLSRVACPGALGLSSLPDNDPITWAQADFSKGLFRRGMGRLNQSLQENPHSLDAWLMKSRFLNAVGFNRSAAEMIESALTKFNDVMERTRLLDEQSFLWAECQGGENALRCANASLELGSSSIRAHYLRGRALALLGRLEDARTEMKHVLTADPENADAQRARPIIEKALGYHEKKRWWQFWES